MYGMAAGRGPGRPVEADPEAIALTALRLFAARGIDEVTMAEVADAAGVSRRTLYRWFPSKGALVWGGAAEADERFEAAWAASADMTLFDRVRAGYEASLAPLGPEPDATRLRLRLIDSSPALAAVGSELQERMGEHLAAHLSEALGVPVDSLRIAALTGALGGASYAALVWWARGEDPRSPAEVIDEALVPLAGLF
jgi:AcrR family transcriptional regulator